MTSVSQFSKIAVIGAGTMGSGIAAQIANADLPVLLLDLPAKTAGQPHAAAQLSWPADQEAKQAGPHWQSGQQSHCPLYRLQ